MTQISKQALLVENNQSFPNNNNGTITPSDLRAYNVDVIDSTVNQIVYTADSASWNQQIDALEVFTSSQQPSFTALNSFTASQLVINSGVNTYTQSANGRLTALESETANLEGFTSSINQIISNGTLLGLSTRFNLVGPNTFFSASITPNFQGPIATLTFSSDSAKLNTSSFNDYTASTAATQSLFSSSVATSISQSSATFSAYSSSQNIINQSVTSSLVQLLNFSSSLDAGFVSEAEFAIYTSSTNQRLTSIESVSGSWITESQTGSFATTGSNSFNGNQQITGELSVTPALLPNGFPGGTGQFIIPFLSGSNNVIARDSDNALYWSPAFNLLAVSASTGNVTTTPSGLNVNSATTGSSNVTSTRITSNFGAGRNITIAGDAAGTALNGLTGITNPSIILQNGSGPLPPQYYAPIQFQSNQTFTDGRVTFTTPLIAQQGVQISGSSTITGSVYGNVSPLSISSNTASMDLLVSNFFTLTLVSGSTTHLSATNIRAGQTINLLVTQPSVGTGSVSYSTSTFNFPAGANYIPTSITGSNDIITFISFDSSVLYATSINNLA
jgi:hypothetical protein